MSISQNPRKNQGIHLSLCPSCGRISEESALSTLRDFIENKAMRHSDMISTFAAFVAASEDVGPITPDMTSGLTHLLLETCDIFSEISDLVDALEAWTETKQAAEAG